MLRNVRQAPIIPDPSGQLPSSHGELTCGPFRLELWSGGLCTFDREWTNRPHRHDDFHELCLVLHGSGEFLHGVEHHVLGPGSLFVSDLGVEHEIRSPHSRDLHLVFGAFRIQRTGLVDDGGTDSRILATFLTGHRRHACAQDHLAALLVAIRAGGAGEAGSWRRLQLWRCFILEGLAALVDLPAADRDRGPRDDRLRRALDVIQRQAHQAIDVATIANAAGCSVRQLRRLCREQVGCTLVQLVAENRLQQARRLLGMRFSVAEAARRSGIGDAARLSRLFRRRFGETPRDYQRRQAPRPATTATEWS